MWLVVIKTEGGRYKIEVNKADRTKTEFTILSGHYEFISMLFGLKILN